MASLLDSAAIVSVGSALPVWRTAFGLDNWAVGFVGSALTGSIALGALLGGRLADVGGRARVFAAALVLYVAGAVVLATAQSTAALLTGVMVLGFASGADLPASLALVAETAPSAVRGRLVALTQVMWTLGIVVASLLAFVVSPFDLAGTRAAFTVLAVGATLTLLGRRATTEVGYEGACSGQEQGDPASDTSSSTASAAGVNRASSLVLIAVFYVLYTLIANTFGAFRTYFLVVVGGTGQTLATAISFALTLLGLGGTLVFSTLVDGRWRRKIFPFAAAVLVTSQIAIAVTAAQSLTVVLLALVAYALAYPYVGEGLYKVWVQEWATPRTRSTFQGGSIAIARAAAAVFALVTPTLMSRHPAVLFWLLSGCALAASVIGIVIGRRQVHARLSGMPPTSIR